MNDEFVSIDDHGPNYNEWRIILARHLEMIKSQMKEVKDEEIVLKYSHPIHSTHKENYFLYFFSNGKKIGQAVVYDEEDFLNIIFLEVFDKRKGHGRNCLQILSKFAKQKGFDTLEAWAVPEKRDGELDFE